VEEPCRQHRRWAPGQKDDHLLPGAIRITLRNRWMIATVLDTVAERGYAALVMVTVLPTRKPPLDGTAPSSVPRSKPVRTERPARFLRATQDIRNSKEGGTDQRHRLYIGPPVRLGQNDVPNRTASAAPAECGGTRPGWIPRVICWAPRSVVAEVSASTASLDVRDKRTAYRRAVVRQYLSATQRTVVDWWCCEGTE